MVNGADGPNTAKEGNLKGLNGMTLKSDGTSEQKNSLKSKCSRVINKQ